jgi:DNA-binding CsgD family transcriptional regulator
MSKHGLTAPFKVRDGLPEDEALHRKLVAATSLAELARRWGVEVHTVWNQCKRLGVPVPTRREAARAAGWNPTFRRPAGNRAYGHGAVAKALELRAEGLSAPEIAREIGVHEDTVRIWLPAGPAPQILALRVRVRELRKQGLGIRATARKVGCSTHFVERWGRQRPILEERVET